MRIAVVEDDDDLLHVITVMLRRAGHEVLTARNGREAVTLVRAEHPDLVLLDLMLPGRDGYEVLEELREDERAGGVPVVLVSALIGTEDQLRGLKLGAVSSITKPFDQDELLSLVDEIGSLSPEALRERHRRALEELPVDGTDVERRPDASGAERFAGVLDLSVDAIVSVDADQRIIGFNRGAAILFGYSAEEVMGQPLDRLLPLDLAGAHADHVQTFARTPEASRHAGERREIHGRRRDGSLFPAEASILRHEVDGRPAFTAVLRDVSERRQLIDELRARARQQAAVADLGQRALAGGAREEFLRDVADTVAATLGVEMVLVVELAGSDRLTVSASIGLDDHPSTVPSGSHLTEVVETSAPVVVARRDGSTGGTRLLGDQPVAGGVGVPLADPRRTFGAIGAYSTQPRSFSEDDVHFLQAVANLVAGFVERERVETRLRRFLDAAPDATLVVAADGTIVSANPRAEELLGYRQDHLVGRVVDDLVPEQAGPTHIAHRMDYGDEPRVRTMGAGRELTALHADGSEIAVDIMLSPIETDEGMLVVAALRDVTHRRRSEAMREAFLRAVSHDLRTPLAALIGYASLLVEEDSIQGDLRTYVERILVNGEKLGRLLGDLLDLDRLSRGVLEPHRRPTVLAELARSVVSSLELPGHDIDVVEEFPDITVNVDPAQVERILENLLVNVGRHTPSGTPCRVRVSRDDGGGVLVVEDEGPGVPDELKESIFEPFQRGGGRGHSPGTGIGLSLVARFAELHDGSASVEDHPGGGARFVIRLGDAPLPD